MQINFSHTTRNAIFTKNCESIRNKDCIKRVFEFDDIPEILHFDMQTRRFFHHDSVYNDKDHFVLFISEEKNKVYYKLANLAY